MSSIQEIFQQVAKMQWSDYLDIIVVAFLLYRIIPLIWATGTARVAKAVVVIVVVAWLTGVLKLYTLKFFFDQFLQMLRGGPWQEEAEILGKTLCLS